ncbi:ABC transporter domain-containing protein [Plasmodiophora brassicae]
MAGGLSLRQGAANAGLFVRRWWRQFKGLTIKNTLIVVVRRPALGAVVILNPILWIYLGSLPPGIWSLRAAGSGTVGNPNPAVTSLQMPRAQPCTLPDLGSCTSPIVYAPDTPATEAVMKAFANSTGYAYGQDIIGFETVPNMASRLYDVDDPIAVSAAITFRGGSVANFLLMTNGTAFGPSGYILHTALHAQILGNAQGSTTPFYVAQTQPLPDITADGDLLYRYTPTSQPFDLQLMLLPVVVTLAYLPIMVLATYTMADEKQSGLVNPLRRLGLYESAYLASIFIPLLILQTAASLVGSITVLCVGAHLLVLYNTSFGIVFLTFWLFGWAMIALGLLTACIPKPVLQKAFTGSIVVLAIVFSLATYLTSGGLGAIENAPPYSYSQYSPTTPPASLYGHSLMPWFLLMKIIDDCASRTVLHTVPDMDGQRVLSLADYPFSQVDDPQGNCTLVVSNTPVTFNPPSTSSTFDALIVITLLYMVAVWYADQIFSVGELGGRQVWYFPVTRRYWFGAQRKTVTTDGDTLALLQQTSAQQQSVNIRKISKTFDKTTAVREVTTSMLPNEVTALLGQNGAGKSTLFNMITGLMEPSAGEGFVCGHSVTHDSASIQAIIGTCSQGDFLWDLLTPLEHIRLYMCFRPPAEGANETPEPYATWLLKQVALLKVKDKVVRTFSGGMKRRMSVVLSLLGEPLLIALDEPTTGMDPINRRRVWNVVERIKSNRVVLLTTHSMEEADHLADKVLIMHRAQLKAEGSTSFLKRRFGKQFEISLLAGGEPRQSLLAFVNSLIPDAEIVEASTGGVRVAVTSAQARFLPAFFKAVREANLAARQNGTRLERECSISHTTLAQVFLKVCQANNDVAIEVVAADNRADDDRAVMEQRCVLCRLRDRERATLYTLDRVPVKVDDLVCVKCATGQHDGDPVLDDRVGNVVAPSPTSPPTPAVPLDVPAPEPARYEPVNDAALGTSVRAVILSQINAVLYKNLCIARHRRRANGCLAVVLFLSIALIALMSGGGTSTQAYYDAYLHQHYCCRGSTCFLYPTAGASQASYGTAAAPTCNLTKAANDLADDWTRQRSSTKDVGSPSIWIEGGNAAAVVSLLAPSSIASGITFRAGSVGAVTRTQTQWKQQATAFPSECSFFQSGHSRVSWLWEEPTSMMYTVYQNASNWMYYSVKPDPIATWKASLPSLVMQIDNSTAAPRTIRASFYDSDNSPCAWTNLRLVMYYNGSLYASACQGVFYAGASQWATPREYNNFPAVTSLVDTASLIRVVASSLATGHPDALNDGTFAPLPTVAFVGTKVTPPGIFILDIFVPLTSMFLMPFAIDLLVTEKQTQLRFMMTLQGMKGLSYWTASIVWIAGTSLLIMVFVVGLSAVITSATFVQANSALLVCTLVSWSLTEAGVAILVSALFRSGGIASIVVYVVAAATTIAGVVFVVLPDYQSSWTMYAFPSILFTVMFHNSVDGPGPGAVRVLTGQIFAMLAVGIAYAVIGWYLQVSLPTSKEPGRPPISWRSLCRPPNKSIQPTMVALALGSTPDHDEDEDVKAERDRVLNDTSSRRLAVSIAGLGKAYDGKAALDDLYLGIEYGECCAILGPNGAGKSTTLNMLCGLIRPTQGTARVGGSDIHDRTSLFRSLGCCPQFDVVWPTLTVRETLAFYARMRSCPSSQIVGWVQRAAENVELDGDPFDTISSSLSGGQRRRLSIAIALIGSPKVVLLDEPTTGLDPDTRLHIWKIIGQQKAQGRCVIITTHSMEEADNLCTRVAIIAAGRLRCVGSQARLKKRFGHGYTITVRMDVSSPDPPPLSDATVGECERRILLKITNFMTTSVSPSARLIDANKSTETLRKIAATVNPGTGAPAGSSWRFERQYLVESTESLDLERVFHVMQNDARLLGVSTWGIAEPSLDDVFVKVAGNFMDED